MLIMLTYERPAIVVAEKYEKLGRDRSASNVG